MNISFVFFVSCWVKFLLFEHSGCAFKIPRRLKLSVNVCVLPYTVKLDSDDTVILRHVLEKATLRLWFLYKHITLLYLCIWRNNPPLAKS